MKISVVKKSVFINIILISIFPSLLFSDIEMMDDIFNLDLQSLQSTKVESASKMEQDISDAPANMKVITKEQIQKRGYRNLADLLADVPGFNIMKFANSGISSFIGIHGVMGQNYFKILRDGIEIDMTQSDIVPVGMNYPLFGIKRVEILYGGASVIYGADAVSGVINLVSDLDLGFSSQISYGTGNYYYGDIKYTTKLNENIFTVQTHTHRDQDYDFYKLYPSNYIAKDIIYNGEVLESAKNRQFSYQPTTTKGVFFLLKNPNWEFGGNYSNTIDSTLISISPNTYLFRDDANLNYEMKGLYFKYKYELSQNSMITSTISYDSTGLDPKSYFLNLNTGYQKGYKYAMSERKALEEAYTYTTDKNSFLLGVSGEQFDSTPLSFDLQRPYLDKTATYPGSDIPVNYYETSRKTYGLFFQDQYKFNKSWQLSIAGRYNINETYVNSFTPRAALIYRNSNSTVHKLIYSESFLAPSTTNEYKHYGYILVPNDGSRVGDTNQYQASSVRMPNPDLEPEKSKYAEYNFSTWFSKNILFESSLYYTKVENMVGDSVLKNVTDSLADVTFLKAKQLYNNSDAVMYGGDFSLLYKYNYNFIDIDSWLNYSYSDGYEELAGVKSDLSYKKSHTLNLGTTFTHQNIDFTPSIKYINGINSGATDTNNPTQKLKAPDYAVANLFMKYRYSDSLSMMLNIQNLFDKRYYDVRQGASSSYLTPQESRLAILSAKITY
ncbi:MAG: TonB-dependent receptor [Sulfurimonas sp.]|jgi:outer membrane receptor for ferrienterochelin and colicin